MLRYVAPAGAPIRLPDLARWVATAVSVPDVSVALRAEVCARFGVRHAFLTCTGRAGMTLLLKAMRRLAAAHRDEVILPSYTCYSVAASIVKAGLRPRIVDISPDTLDYAPAELARADYSRVLAIIATNLYGLPNDLPTLSRVARDQGVFLIDDAAQAMGASVGGRPSGAWGDAGLFSFDKGKNVSAVDGGVVVTSSDDVARALDRELSLLQPPGIATSGLHIAKALAYFAMLRPWLYGIPARIPQLGLGKTVFTTDFPLARPDPALTALALVMMRRLEAFTRARVVNAADLLRQLVTVPGIRTVAPRIDAIPVYLRLPILLDPPLDRDAAIASCTAVGIGASGSYPACLADVSDLRQFATDGSKRFDGGRHVARCIVTLPTQPMMTANDKASILRTIQGAASMRAA
jgi:perosamine synthetase